MIVRFYVCSSAKLRLLLLRVVNKEQGLPTVKYEIWDNIHSSFLL